MALFKILRGNAANLPTEKKDGYAYFCTDTHDFYIDYKKADGTLTRGQLNANAADKLSTGRTIGLGTAVSSTATTFDGSKNITIPVNGVKEAYLTWGGKNFAGGCSPLDASMVPQLGANRFAFLKEAGIIVEYSRDSGTTWTEIESTTKHRLFGAMGSNHAGYTIGNNTTAGADTSTYQLRITIDSVAAGVYSVLKKFAIYISTNGGQNCWCSIEAKTATNVDSGNDVWTKFADQVAITGWSGWNIINTTGFTSYSGSASQKSQYQKIRFIFGNQSHSGASYKGLQINQILAFGESAWTFPSNMARYGTLYSYDCEQNATFPKKVTAATLASTGDATVAGTLSVTGASTLTGAVTSGALTASSLKSNGALTVTGNSTLSGTLTVKGNTTLGDATTDTVTIKGPLTAETTLTVKGNTTLGDAATDTVTIKGPITADSTSTFSGAATFSSTVSTGALTASSLTSNGTLSVTGASTFTGAITANGNVTLGNSSTADTTTLTSKLVANGTSNFKAAMTATSITASGKVTSSEFVGDLTGTADEAISLTWTYFNDNGVIS